MLKSPRSYHRRLIAEQPGRLNCDDPPLAKRVGRSHRFVNRNSRTICRQAGEDAQTRLLDDLRPDAFTRRSAGF